LRCRRRLSYVAARVTDFLFTLLHVAVTTASCVAPVASDPCCGAPRHLSTDHDPLFEAHRWAANLRILEIDEIKTAPHVPLSHPYVERLIGTMRREFLGHVLFWNTRDLERKLGQFQVYYNAARCHESLEGHTPLAFASGHTAVHADFNHVRWVCHCRDLVQLPVAA
jgi:putative transposase